jgi:hypothetical protein
MARSNPKLDAVILPPVGSVFLMPLDDGRYGVCRVIRHGAPFSDTPRALVVASPWIGTGVPDLDEPLLREQLVLNHHSWNNKVEAFYAFDNVPADFRLLGEIAPTDEDAKLTCSTLTRWDSAPLQVLLQWRWDNDRNALLAEEQVDRQKDGAAALEKQRRRQEYLASVTLAQLRDKERFATWEGSISDELLIVCRHVFQETIDSLLEFEGKLPKKRMVAALRECVLRLNDLDAEHEFIETVEREDLCQEIDEIAHACGFPKEVGVADRWRDW